MTYQSSSLRSIYRSINNQSSTYRQDSCFQQITPGICDYIPSSLFNKQFLSILIQGDLKQIIYNILWNQFYSKTLLKQIYENLNRKKSNQSLMLNGWNKKQEIFIKTGNSIFNVKDKLQYENAQLIQDKIMNSKQLLIQTFSDQGSWKKINIEIGLYKDRKFYDIVFALKKNLKIQQMSEEKQILSRQSLKNKTPSSPKKINSDIKKNKNNNIKHIQVELHSTKKKNTSSLTQSNNKLLNKQNNNQREEHEKAKKLKNLMENIVKPQRKVSISSLSNTLKQKNWSVNKNLNNTQKISIKQKLNFDQFLPIQSSLQSLSMKRKNNSQKKQLNELFDSSNQIKKSIQNQNSKTSCVLTQIIQKKDKIISSQVKKLEQLQDSYQNQIQEIKAYTQQKIKGLQQQLKKALFQIQSNKVKFFSQNQSLNQAINNIKQLLQAKESNYKFLQKRFNEQVQKNQVQATQIVEMRFKQEQMNVKYQKLLIQSKQQAMSLFKQLNNLRQQKESVQKKYKNLMQKVKILTQQQ